MAHEASAPHRTGERNTGSVRVADLLARHARVRDLDEVPGGPPVPDPDEPSRRDARGDDERTTRPGRLVGVAGFAIGAAVLAGTVALGAAALAAPDDTADRAAPPAAADTASGYVTGPEVLRPDLIATTIAEPAAAPQAAPDTPGAALQQGTRPDAEGLAGAATEPARGQASVAPAGDQGPTVDPPAERSGTANPSDPVVRPVLAFYAAVADTPAQAFMLLTPSMQDGDFPGFARSWRSVAEATVRDVDKLDADSVLVRVTLQRDDGSRLHTTQRLSVEPGGSHRIVDAVLLSAVNG